MTTIQVLLSIVQELLSDSYFVCSADVDQLPTDMEYIIVNPGTNKYSWCIYLRGS
ncbi:hypothetical protein ACQKM1_24420 [Peribacillus frigoritolerans]|uniref:hypothetical protein n=1 Tax=Peribacillus frigoritolerans TaxID=450367 RepID=UPI003D04ABED